MFVSAKRGAPARSYDNNRYRFSESIRDERNGRRRRRSLPEVAFSNSRSSGLPDYRRYDSPKPLHGRSLSAIEIAVRFVFHRAPRRNARFENGRKWTTTKFTVSVTSIPYG